MVTLSSKEVTNLIYALNAVYNYQSDITIEHQNGGGIGTVTLVKFGLNKLDITDYSSW
jgi:hypothetical protein